MHRKYIWKTFSLITQSGVVLSENKRKLSDYDIHDNDTLSFYRIPIKRKVKSEIQRDGNTNNNRRRNRNNRKSYQRNGISSALVKHVLSSLLRHVYDAESAEIHELPNDKSTLYDALHECVFLSESNEQFLFLSTQKLIPFSCLIHNYNKTIL